MRIISQDRTSDIPYDRVTLYTCKCPGAIYHICASLGFDEKDDFHIGEYESKERCIEILQEIRESEKGIIFIKNQIHDDDIEEMKNELKHSQIIFSNCGSVNVFPGETYFYMPEE